MREAIKAERVSKVFHHHTAVHEVSFAIHPGEVVAILGPNGAGKTTMISMILGLLVPSNGKISVLEHPPAEKAVREQIGAMLQDVSIMHGLKVKELLDLVRSYYPDPLPLPDLIDFTGLNEKDIKTRVEKLSGGQKRRLNFGLALAGDPKLLILDEPTVGLDVHSRRLFWKTIRQLAGRGKTVIFSTHYLQEADDVADRILLFKEGRIIADGTPAKIKASLLTRTVSFQADCPVEIFKEWSAVQQAYTENGRHYLKTKDSDEVLARLFALNIGAKEIQVESGNLETAFEQLTAKPKGGV
ncbi:ABC transporter ATP-binding protein [Bacillus xiapuensis]|uniref:ABC transporter ATP-binding protein n=1 Tax=Bacillus xiapuensis TaxID=2014075 RepID=UPI000C230DA3|nr:ABC transporter ATP-binding protein [Bacillus xiapuensis]